MAHGAPDHVGMTDINLLDYTDKIKFNTFEIIGPLDSYNVIDVVGVGCFNSLVFEVDSKSISVQLFVDGVLWLPLYFSVLWTALKLTGASGYPNFGVLRYDEINDNYGIWLNFNWNLFFGKSLKLVIENHTPANITCTGIVALWKERD